MSTLRLALFVLTSLLLGATLSCAQETRPDTTSRPAAKPTTQPAEKPPAQKPTGQPAEKPANPSGEMKADQISSQLVHGFREKEYVTGEGLKRLTMGADYNVTVEGEKAEGAFSYLWDGKEGKMTLDDPSHQFALHRAGFTVQMLSLLFRHEELAGSYAGCMLTAETVGDHTKVYIEGQARNAMQSMLFDERGLLVGFERKPPQMTEAIVAKVGWLPAQERWLRKSMEMSISMGPIGTMNIAMECGYQEVEGLQMWKHVAQTVQMNGAEFARMQIDFRDIQINPPAPKIEAAPPSGGTPEAAPKTEPKGAPTSQPASRPRSQPRG